MSVIMAFRSIRPCPPSPDTLPLPLAPAVSQSLCSSERGDRSNRQTFGISWEEMRWRGVERLSWPFNRHILRRRNVFSLRKTRYHGQRFLYVWEVLWMAMHMYKEKKAAHISMLVSHKQMDQMTILARKPRRELPNRRFSQTLRSASALFFQTRRFGVFSAQKLTSVQTQLLTDAAGSCSPGKKAPDTVSDVEVIVPSLSLHFFQTCRICCASWKARFNLFLSALIQHPPPHTHIYIYSVRKKSCTSSEFPPLAIITARPAK